MIKRSDLSHDSGSEPEISEAKVRSFLQGMQTLADSQRAAIVAFEKGLPKIRAALLTVLAGIAVVAAYAPRNWLDMAEPPSDEIANELTAQGFVLMWVPRGEILGELCSANSFDERADVLLRRTTDVIEDCRQVLADVTTSGLDAHARLVLRALEALEGGHFESAQALAANVLDSLRSHELPSNVRRMIRQQDQDSISALGIQGAIVYAALLGVFESWYPGDAVPETMAFSRHVTAHTVEASQYTKLNAILAVMHATSVLRHIQAERNVRVSR